MPDEREPQGTSDAPAGLRAALLAYGNPRLPPMLGLGFGSGLPLYLLGPTLVAWLHDAEIGTAAIGFWVGSVIALPMRLKPLWAPALDRFQVPFLGRRRGWILVFQLLVGLGLAAMGWFSPRDDPRPLIAMATAVAFFAASQDIVVDAYRTDVLRPPERASGAATYVAAYRVAMIVASAGALALADWLPWSVVYPLVASTMAVAVLTTLVSPAPERPAAPPRTLRESVVEPFRELLTRRHALLLLALVATYKVGDSLAALFMNDFLLEVGYSRSAVAGLNKTLGLGATIAGVMLAGGLVAAWGLWRSLVTFGVLQALANVLYAELALHAIDLTRLGVYVTVDHLFNGMGTAAFAALLMALCDRRYSAFQYALLTALMGLPAVFLATPIGLLAEQAGWVVFFVASAALGLPALAFLSVPGLLAREEATA